MEQATKFFQDFNTGLKEVINISDEIKDWFSNLNILNLTEHGARTHLTNRFEATTNKEDETLSVTETSLWYESKDHLGLTWKHYQNNEYVFIVDGYYFDDNKDLKNKFDSAGGWKIIPCT